MDPLASPLVWAFAHHLRDAVLLTDATPWPRGGPRIVGGNDAGWAVLGWPAEAARDQPVRPLLHRSTDRHTIRRLRRAVREGQAVREIVTLQRSDGGRRDVELDVLPTPAGAGYVAGFAWLLRDRATEQCRLDWLATHRLAATFDPDALAILDGDGVIRLATPALERMLGCGTPHELVGVSLAELCPPSEKAIVERGMSALLGRSAGYSAYRAPERPPLRVRVRQRSTQQLRTLELDAIAYTALAATPETADAKAPAGALVLLARDLTALEQRVREDSGRLSAVLAQVSDTEKAWTSRSLHEGVGQQVMGAALLAKTLADQLQRDGHPLLERAMRVSSLLLEAVDQIRSMSVLFMPLFDRTLADALDRLAAMVSSHCGVRCEVEIDTNTNAAEAHVPMQSEAIRTHLYWIAQEAVMNAVRHANAALIRVRLRGSPPALEVEDDGQGLLATRDDRGDVRGMGLRVMQCRAEQIGWTLQVECPDGAGTRVRCAPLAASAPAESAAPPTRRSGVHRIGP